MDGNFSEIIVEKFTKKFIAAFKALSGPGKNRVIKYSPIVFKRWYYSALINETTLSPSFIHGASLGASSILSAPAVTPQVAGVHFKGFSIKENKYSIGTHPVVSDIKILLDFCVPDVELDADDNITQPFASKILHFLSIADPYYAEYLTAVAFELKLLKKSAAIYSNKATISNNYTLFTGLNQEEALKKIVTATVKICSRNINSALPSKLPFLSESGIVELIKKPVPIDNIFKTIFGAYGVDIETLWDNYNDNPGNVEGGDHAAMLSSTFFLGIVLDKWFITPFGEYLKLIEPIYCFHFNFNEELGYLFDVIKTSGNVETALFSPCAFYSFTPLGRRFFAFDVNEADKRKKPLIPVSELIGLLNFDEPAAEGGSDTGIIISKEVYSFKIKCFEDKRYWKQIDAAEYNSLHELHIEIAINFDFSFTGYSIFADESMSPFCRYGDPKAKGERRKADKVTLEQLNLKKGEKLYYVAETGKKLEIELIKRIPMCRKAHFPQTVRLSKLMRDQENAE